MSVVHCQFKHIPSKRDAEQLACNIETFVRPKTFDKEGIKKCGENGNDEIEFTLTREEANKVREKFKQVLPNENSPVWFTILSNPLDSLISHSLETTTIDVYQQGTPFSASCQFGSLRSYNQFYSHTSFNGKVVKLSFIPSKKPDTLYIEFDDIRIVIPFVSIQKKNVLVNKDNAEDAIYVLLPLKYAPNVFKMEPIKGEDKTAKNSNKKPVRICADQRHVDFITDIAQCSDLVLYFAPPKERAWQFLSYFFIIDQPERYHINFSTFKISDWSTENNKKQRPDPFNFGNASFQDRYALQMLISLGYVFRDKWAQLTDQVLNWSKWNLDERYTLCCYAVEQLCNDHGYDLTRTARDYNETRRRAVSNMDEQTILVGNRERLKVATCTLTPLKIIFQPLEVTMGSRALRNSKFGGPEQFLLVHFRDEDNRRLRVSNSSIKHRLKNAMLNGIELWKKTFKYIGASTGQMKEMGFWFIDLPPDLKDMKDARDLLGKFDNIKNIATYIARVGQYFSTTWPIGIKLVKVANKSDIRSNDEAYYVYEENDIKRNDAQGIEYCFTDGIGKISWGLAGRVAQQMNIPLYSKEDIPSAYQIRVAGCKGMVAIDPESTLNDYYISVRGSMIKFPSDDWNLEICEFARPMTLTLNNQVIRLLSDLGNHDDVFIAFQNQGFTQWEVPEDQQPSAIDIAVQKNASYSLSKDNLITNRIPIPPEDGRNLFGIADETGELKYGECFIQCSSLDAANNGQRKFRVITGTVLVTKNPCLWPGDFRQLRAVRNRKLEECMRDVIVFPVNGHRPHSNEIAGSDLDGDQYWVYWGDRLRIEQNVEPLSYEGAKKTEVSLITQEIIVNHIVESFGAGIILGMIANTHTVVADQHKDHSFSRPCKKLAELFALAVDSPKTGKFVDKAEIRPFQAEYCKSWPKYMRKFGEPSYKSMSVLEKLFSNAVEKYYKWHEKPVINTFPQKMGAIKGATTREIQDHKFKKWLDGESYKETVNPNKPQGKVIKESDNNKPPDTSLATTSKKTTKRSTTATTDNLQSETKKLTNKLSEDTPNRPETPVKPKSTTNRKTKNTSDEEKPNVLINSDVSASVASSLASSLTSLNSDLCQPDFLMAVDTKTSTLSVIQFTPIAGASTYTVNLNKETTNTPDRDVIVGKLMSYIEKQAVFKKKSSPYNEAIHGSLYLMVFYGDINFVEQNPMPQKLGILEKLIEEKNDQFIDFKHADINGLHIQRVSSSTTMKNKIDYEFDCRLTSTSSEYYTLLYDKNKILRQIRLYRLWSKCYVRQPGFNTDSLYEIRSVIIHDAGSSEFNRIVDLVLRPQSTGLFDGRRPNIKINRSLLHSSVVPISLKVIEEDQETRIYPLISEAFYRKVKYVSIDEQQDKPKVTSTMEYHVSPISKDQDMLKQVCDFALLPTEE
ncbi:unnamed protein product [Adineta steineri]|uniref:RNA-dependent RNA polymerase n=1 Tax=Adineta steineri TaxID=433720 RepID=A0A814LMB9_9BILA|nr:unnamed protein product [Adineta steineri]CAF1068378.1 unnamed protein product [Adineta steineri]CAF3699684.1 unnamed protein product [Adineta steineri]CAF3934899.1 unnamed protein product [Adineta steineri]